MRKEIKGPEEIRQLVDRFYEKVRADDSIGFLFNDVARVDWEKHLPVMYQFWQQILFGDGDFKGNPLAAHQRLHQRSPLSSAHFKQWVFLFHQTVAELFEGEVAELAKQRASSIATVMEIRIVHAGISTSRP